MTKEMFDKQYQNLVLEITAMGMLYEAPDPGEFELLCLKKDLTEYQRRLDDFIRIVSQEGVRDVH